MRLLCCLEQNCCCIRIARCGFSFGGRHRKKILGVGLAANFLALVLLTFASLGSTGNDNYLRFAPWFHGAATYPGGLEAEVYVGAIMRTDLVDCAMPMSTFPNASACGYELERLGFQRQGHLARSVIYIRNVEWSNASACRFEQMTDAGKEVATEMCEHCKDNIVSKASIILSLLLQVPTITTDLQRMTIFGDVNCQASMGFITNGFSLFTTLYTLLSFRAACFTHLPAEIDGVALEWGVGAGFSCLMVAAFMKAVDCICHFCVPTPSARWIKPPDNITELQAYMILACAAEGGPTKADLSEVKMSGAVGESAPTTKTEQTPSHTAAAGHGQIVQEIASM